MDGPVRRVTSLPYPRACPVCRGGTAYSRLIQTKGETMAVGIRLKFVGVTASSSTKSTRRLTRTTIAQTG